MVAIYNECYDKYSEVQSIFEISTINNTCYAMLYVL